MEGRALFSASRLLRRGLGVLRLPVLLLIVVVAVTNYHRLVGGTGGLDPSWIGVEEDGTGRSIHWVRYFCRSFGPAIIVLLSLASVIIVIRAGSRTALAGLRFLLGTRRPDEHTAAATALGIGARVVTWAGLILGVAATGVCTAMVFANRVLHVTGGEYYYDEWDEEEEYMDFLDYLHSEIAGRSVFVPLVGLVLGRIVLGALADAARAQSTSPLPAAFSRRHDVLLIVVAILLAYRYLPFFWY